MFAVTLSMLVFSSAHALSWSPGFERAFPTDGATEVARNVSPVVEVHGMDLETSDGSMAEHRLALVLADGGEAVSAAVEHLGSGVYQIQPDGDLLPETTYAVVSTPVLPLASDPLITFQTGTDFDDTQPTIPQPFDVYQTHEADEWGDWFQLVIEQHPAGDVSGVVHHVTVATLDCALGRVACESPEPGIFIRSGAEAEPDPESGVPHDALHFRFDPVGNDDHEATMDPSSVVITIETLDLAGNAAAEVCAVPAGIDPLAVGCDEAAMVHTIINETQHDGMLRDRRTWDLDTDVSSSGCSMVGAHTSGGLSLLALASALRRRTRRSTDATESTL